MNKWTATLTTTLLLTASAQAAQWPQPESAYHASEPRAQWLETAPTPPAAPAAQQPTWQQPWQGYGAPAQPGYGYGYGGYGYAPRAPWAGYYTGVPRPPRSAPWRNGNWPSWDNFSMPSFSSPSFSFPAPFGW